ncbi:MAG TPA: glycosyltransferase family 4 protein [Candidatus Saccharimonadia bacterium]|nr:glycosyltransferase family 4 protein [Candidatus Saccharimonadia bacterium]
MKILVVTPYFAPALGGLENYALNLAKELHEAGHDIVVVTANHRGNHRVHETINGLRIIRLPITAKLSNTPIGLGWYFQLRTIIHTEQPDLVNAHTPVPFIADMAVRAAGQIPTILTYHNDLAKSSLLGLVFTKLYYALLGRRTLRLATRIITTSQYYADLSPYLAAHRGKIAVVPPGVDIAAYHSGIDKTWLHQRHAGQKIVLFVASLKKSHAHKGLNILLQSFARALSHEANLHLVVVGEGDGTAGYQQQANSLGLSSRVTFAGRVSDEALPRYFAGADVAVLPSVNASEGFGMVLLEAQACGTPVIGSRIGGIPAVVEHGRTGELVAASSVPELTSSLLRILGDDAYAARLGRRGAETVAANFSWQHQAQRFEAIAIAVLDQHPQTIVQVVSYYPPHTGGMENAAREISHQLAALGHHVEIFTSNIAAPAGRTQESGCTVHRLPSLEIAHTPIIWSLFWQLMTVKHPSIIHVHVAQAYTPEIAYLVSRLRRIPLVLHFHQDVGASGLAGKILPIYKKFSLGPLLRRAELVIAISPTYRQFLVDAYRLHRLAIVSNGVGPEFFTPKTGFKPDSKRPLRLLYVGRLSWEKNVGLLIEATKNLGRPVELQIVGNGPLEQNLAQIIAASPHPHAHITMAGYKTKAELPAYYRQAQMVLIASDYEIQPLVALEAMASGTPVIGSRIPGLIDTLGDDGLIVDKTATAFRDGILQLADNPTLWQTLSRRGQAKAKRLSWDQAATQLDTLYAALSAHHPAPAAKTETAQ